MPTLTIYSKNPESGRRKKQASATTPDMVEACKLALETAKKAGTLIERILIDR